MFILDEGSEPDCALSFFSKGEPVQVPGEGRKQDGQWHMVWPSES